MEKTIVLVGLMGAGKTAIGRRLAKRLNIPFVDIDQEIEKQQGCTISQYFEYMNEASFRKLEKETIAAFLKKPPHVMATGGGAFINEETRNLIKEQAISICLKANLNVLIERVSGKKTRPLLEKGDKREIMKKLMDERYPIYEKADIIVKSDLGSHGKVVNEIIRRLGIND